MDAFFSDQLKALLYAVSFFGFALLGFKSGVEELDQEKLPELLTLKYHALSDAAEILGGVENIRTTFIDFQKYLYERRAA